MNHLLALLGITLLCALWVLFQLWLKRVDPSKEGFRPGCGGCQGGGCSQSGCATDKSNTEATVSRQKSGPGASPGENP